MGKKNSDAHFEGRKKHLIPQNLETDMMPSNMRGIIQKGNMECIECVEFAQGFILNMEPYKRKEDCILAILGKKGNAPTTVLISPETLKSLFGPVREKTHIKKIITETCKVYREIINTYELNGQIIKITEDKLCSVNTFHEYGEVEILKSKLGYYALLPFDKLGRYMKENTIDKKTLKTISEIDDVKALFENFII